MASVKYVVKRSPPENVREIELHLEETSAGVRLMAGKTILAELTPSALEVFRGIPGDDFPVDAMGRLWVRMA